MTRPSSVAGSSGPDLVYAGITFVAAALTVLGESFDLAVIAAVVLALVPVVLVVAGVRIPLLAFAALAIIPVVPVVVVTGIGSAIFMAISAASRVASRSDRRWLVAVVTAVVIALPFVTFLPFVPSFEYDIGVVYFAFGSVFGVLVGVLLRRSTRLADELRRADAELANANAREERHRLARDVHDLVAHSLTVVVLHVGGARRVLRSDPVAAENALTEAERVSRESLDAIRGAVGLLREDGEPSGQSLDLERLVGTYRSAGVPVTLRTDGDTESLPMDVRSVVYRVIQEALANSARYSTPGSSTTVDIETGSQQVFARVENQLDDSWALREAPVGGYGLLGLREQVTALGGQLTSGPLSGTWVVECRLPIGGAS
jgi:signal transduction histidine kinase